MVQSTTRNSVIGLSEDRPSATLTEKPLRVPESETPDPPQSHLRTRARHGVPDARRWLAAWPVLLVLGCYVGIAFFAYWHAWLASTPSVIEPGGQDSQLNIWFIAWIPYALLHGHNPFFTVYGNYPYGVNLLTGTGEVLLGLLATPITLIFGPIVSYNALLTTALASSAFCGYLLARKFTTWRPAAFVAGLLYGFSPYMIGQGQYHLNLSFVPIPPLIFLVLYELLVEQKRSAMKWGALLALLVCAQYFISTEVLADTALVAAIGVALLSVTYRKSFWKRFPHAAAGIGMALAFSALVLAWPTFYALNGPAHITGSINPIPSEWNRADLLGAIVPNQDQLIAPARLTEIGNSFAFNPPENGSYLGLPLIVILTSAVLLRRHLRVLLFSVAMLGACFVLSLGSPLVVSGTPQWSYSGIPLPQALLNEVPLVKDAEPARFALFVALFASIAFAAVLNEIRYGRRRHRTRRPDRKGVRIAFAGFVAVAALVLLVPSWPYPSGTVDIPSFFTSADVDSIPTGSVALLYPYPATGIDDDFPVLWQTAAGMRFKFPGGYFIVPQAGTNQASLGRATLIAEALFALYEGSHIREIQPIKRELLQELQSWRVRTVIAQPIGTDPGLTIQYLTWLLGRKPTFVGGVDVWYNVHLSP
jgi:hypothetical protein